MVSFEIFVKAMPPRISELKVLPSFCFAFKIPDDRAVTNTYNTYKVICCQPKSRFAGHSRSSEVVGKVHVSSFHLLSATTLSSYWLILRMEFFLKRANLGCNLVLVLILKNLSSCSEPHCLPSSPQSHEQALHGKAQLRAAWLPCGKTRAYPNFPLIFWYTHLERQDVYT